MTTENKTPDQLRREAVQAQRDSIQVTSTNIDATMRDDEKKAADDAAKEAAEGGEEKDEAEVTAKDDGGEEKDEKEEKEEKEGEEKEEKDETELEAKEPTADELKRTIERLKKRIDKGHGQNKDLKRELADTRSKLEAKQVEEGEVLTRDDVEREAERLANQKLIQKEFSDNCAKLEKAAVAADKQFLSKIDSLAEEIGVIPGQMIGILSDLDNSNGGAVLAYLADNPDEAEEIWPMNPGRMGLRLAKISEKLQVEATEKAKKAEADKKKKEDSKKKISSAPEPKETLGGAGGAAQFNPQNTKIDSKEWIRQRNEQVARNRAAKAASMR